MASRVNVSIHSDHNQGVCKDPHEKCIGLSEVLNWSTSMTKLGCVREKCDGLMGHGAMHEIVIKKHKETIKSFAVDVKHQICIIRTYILNTCENNRSKRIRRLY